MLKLKRPISISVPSVFYRPRMLMFIQNCMKQAQIAWPQPFAIGKPDFGKAFRSKVGCYCEKVMTIQQLLVESSDFIYIFWVLFTRMIKALVMILAG